ncbi:MAG TPA: PDGLE domain-containing protein [Actinophytocola sp.]|uniref:PDGLE domain-containing protein n=1 Tax=Actinophytocola sp. TaxID=1872138 RepID=UPI002DDCAC11|nr:PDGLE domain-containing protein [Actinophytocola sp.]HEV2781020.1 PDGLE domain-containing protein [Actinophytocola sp.]
MNRRTLFFIGFAIVALVLAGVVSYFASSSPDGLDATLERGCDAGACIADNAREHDGPLAGYTIGGDSRLTGVAGVIGTLATLALAFGLFSLLRKRSRS